MYYIRGTKYETKKELLGKIVIVLLILFVITIVFIKNQIQGLDLNRETISAINENQKIVEDSLKELKNLYDERKEELKIEDINKLNNEVIDVIKYDEFPAKLVCNGNLFYIDENLNVNYVEEYEDTIVTYEKVSLASQDKKINILLKVFNEKGIKSIECPDGDIIKSEVDRNDIGIDYVVDEDIKYVFKIIDSEGKERIKEILLKHNDYEKVDEKIATSTENGYKEYRCKNCGELYRIETHAPTKPTILVFPKIENDTFKKGRSITLTADGSTDEDGDEIEYVWEGRLAETSSDYKVGTHIVKVKAVDSTGAESDCDIYQFTVTEQDAVILDVYNNSSANFDVRASNGTIRTTFNNNGYASVVKVGDTENTMTSKETNLKNIHFVRNSEYDENMNCVKTTYTVTNNGTTQETIGIAVHADIQIGSNDGAPIYSTKTGFRMTDGTYSFYVYLKNLPIINTVDTIWYGQYSQRTSNLWNSTSADSITGIDSGMAFSWKDRSISPGETQTYSFIITIE